MLNELFSYCGKERCINVFKCSAFFIFLFVVLLFISVVDCGKNEHYQHNEDSIFNSDVRYTVTLEEKLQKRADEIEAQKAAELAEQQRNEAIARYSNTWFCQYDGKWAWYGYGSDTIGGGGCGLCSATVIIDCLLNRDLTPPEVSDDMYNSFGGWGEYYLPGAGTIHAGMLEYLERQGLSVWRCDVYEAIDYVKTHKSDACIYISSKGPFMTNEGITYWTGGHIVAAYYVDDDYIYVQDSARLDTYNVAYTYDEFIDLSYNANTVAVISK